MTIKDIAIRALCAPPVDSDSSLTVDDLGAQICFEGNEVVYRYGAKEQRESIDQASEACRALFGIQQKGRT